MSRSTLSIVFAVALAACSEGGEAVSAPPPGTPVAWVGDEVVVAEELRLPGAGDAQARQAALDAAVLDRLAVLAARDSGLAEHAAVVPRIQAIERRARAEERSVLRNALRTEIAASVRLSDAELREYYDANLDRFRDRTYTLRRTGFDTRREAEQALTSKEPFAELVGPIPLTSLPRELQRAAIEMRREGGRTVVESEGRWWAVERVESDFGPPRPFEEVREQVRHVLLAQRAREELERRIEEKRSEVEIRVDEAALAALGSGNSDAPVGGRAPH